MFMELMFLLVNISPGGKKVLTEGEISLSCLDFWSSSFSQDYLVDLAEGLLYFRFAAWVRGHKTRHLPSSLCDIPFLGWLEPLSPKEVFCSTFYNSHFSVFLPESHLRGATSLHCANWVDLGFLLPGNAVLYLFFIYIFIVLDCFSICHGLDPTSVSQHWWVFLPAQGAAFCGMATAASWEGSLRCC